MSGVSAPDVVALAVELRRLRDGLSDMDVAYGCPERDRAEAALDAALQALGAAAIPPLAAALERAGRGDAAIVEALARSGRPEAAAPLLEHMERREGRSDLGIVFALRELRPDAGEVLDRIDAGDRRIGGALAVCGGDLRAAVERLLAMLEGADPSPRRPALDGLHALSSTLAAADAARVAQALQWPRWRGVTLEILEALGERARGAIPHLQALVRGGEAGAQANRLLAALGVADVEAALAALGDPTDAARAAAAQALGAQGVELAIPALKALAREGAGRRAHDAAVNAVAAIQGDAAAPFLASCLQPVHPRRFVALRRLAALSPSVALLPLAAQLEDPELRGSRRELGEALEALWRRSPRSGHDGLDAFLSRCAAGPGGLAREADRRVGATPERSLEVALAGIASGGFSGQWGLLKDTFAWRGRGPLAAAGVPALVEQLSVVEGVTLNNLVELLRWIGPTAAPALPHLLRFLDRPPAYVSRRDVWRTIAALGPAAAAARDRLGEDEARCRPWLGLPDPEAAAALMEELREGRGDKILLWRALGHLGAGARGVVDEAAWRLAQQHYQEGEALLAFAGIGGEVALGLLERALERPAPDCFGEDPAARAWGRVPGRRGAEVLERLLLTDSAHRPEAARQLLRHGGPRAAAAARRVARARVAGGWGGVHAQAEALAAGVG